MSLDKHRLRLIQPLIAKRLKATHVASSTTCDHEQLATTPCRARLYGLALIRPRLY